MTRTERVAMVDRAWADLSVRRQCNAARIGALRGLLPAGALDAEELALTRWIDAQYLATPFYGLRRMTTALRLAGHRVNRKQVQRPNAADGPRSTGSKFEDQLAVGAPPGLRLPAARVDDRPSEPSMGCRHYSHPNGPGASSIWSW
jgi:HTH-like domain